MSATAGTWAMLALAATGAAAGAAVPAAAQDAAYGQAQSGYATGGYNTDGQSVDSIAVFFEPLSHYGRWLDGRYGRVWAPNVPRDWRPYTIGHWDDGAYGPTWRSDEPFGWAVFHFGRWAFDPTIGWVWLPDTVWGPGWVAWRDGDDIAGWAPLPPQIDPFFAAGFAFNDWGYDQWYQPGWSYVPRAYLFARTLRGVYFPYARNREFWDRSRGVTRYDRVDGQIVNRSFGRGRGDDSRILHGAQTYGQSQRPAAPPPADAPRDGFAPGAFGGRDGFVPGTPPRGFDRRMVPVPGVAPPRPLAMPAPRPMAAAPRPAPAAPRARPAKDHPR